MNVGGCGESMEVVKSLLINMLLVVEWRSAGSDIACLCQSQSQAHVASTKLPLHESYPGLQNADGSQSMSSESLDCSSCAVLWLEPNLFYLSKNHEECTKSNKEVSYCRKRWKREISQLLMRY